MDDSDRMVLMAEPGFLGQLRGVMPKSLLKTVVQQVNKNLVCQDDRTIVEHLTAEVFEAPMR